MFNNVTREASWFRGLDQICDRFERAWQQGESPDLLQHLGDARDPERAWLLRELLLLEVAYRLRRGEQPQLADYQARFPDQHSLLQSVFVELKLLSPPLASDLTVAGQYQAAPAKEPSPLKIGGYEVLAELGRGGMGVVYKARHLALNRVVALKMVLSGSHAGPTELQRFRTEAEAVARLDHPNIVHVYDVGEHEGKPFYSMEYCPGGSLEAKLAGTPLPPQQAAALVETLARAMHDAHSHSVIHRDLKPANILLTAEGTPKVTDFGLAKKLDEASQTRTGAVMGTPSYMAPEQADGQSKELGPACDVYALGAILYECLTGKPPFRAASALDTIFQVLNDEPVPVRQFQPKVTRDLETVCLKCLRKEPVKRYASAGDLADDLRRVQAGDPIKARPVGGAERLVRWCRRNPVVAALAAASVVLLLTVAAVASAGYVQTAAALSLVEQQKQEAVTQRDAANRHLYTSLVGEARALRLARTEGYRDQCWDLLGEALRLDTPDRDETVLRREAVACLGDWVGLSPTTWTDRPGNERLTAMAAHPDGVHLAFGYANGVIQVRRLDSGQEVARIEGSPHAVRGLQFGASGNTLVVGNAAKTIRVWKRDPAGTWRSDKNREIATKQTLHYLMVMPDEARALFGEYGGPTIHVVDLNAGVEPDDFRGDHGEKLHAPSLSRDGKLLVAGFSKAGPVPNEGVLIWDVATRKLQRTLGSVQGPVLNVVQLSPDGKLLVFNAGDQGLLLYDTVDFRQQGLLRSDTVEKAAFTPDGRLLVFTTITGALYVWNVTASGLAPVRIPDFKGTRVGLAVSGDGRRVITVGVGVVRIRSLGSTEEKLFTAGHAGGVPTIAFSPDGKLVASAGKDRLVTLWDAHTGFAVRTLPQFPAFVQSVAFSPDGRLLITGDYAHKIGFWDVGTGQEVTSLTHPQGAVYKAIFSPDGKHFAATAGGLSVWSVTWEGPKPSFRPVISLPGSRSTYATISADSRLLTWVNSDRSIRLWDLEQKKELPDIPAMLSMGWHNTAALPDGDRMAFIGSNQTLEVWDARRKVKTLELGEAKEFDNCHIGVSADGRWAATDPVPAAATIWDLQEGKRVLDLPAESGPIWSLAWSPDGRRLAVGLSDGGVLIWDLERVQKQLTDASLASATSFD